ncbi:MAG: acetate--CoA ligase family protein [Thermoanaerobaculia bacterium]
MPDALSAARAAVAEARAAGRRTLLETEGLSIARALGLGVPRRLVVPGPHAVDRAALDSLPGDRVVLKVLAAGIAHKTDVGGVAVVQRDVRQVRAGLLSMQERLAGRAVEGYLLEEFVPHDLELGGQLLLGMRWTADFGPVVTLGPGGLTAEELADALRPGRGGMIAAPLLGAEEALASFRRSTAGRLALEGLRGRPPAVTERVLAPLLERCLRFADAALPELLMELEINPVALTAAGPVALDAVARLGEPVAELPAPRPLATMERLLRPRSAAVLGVSRGDNPGHVILRNMLRSGFPPDHLAVIKPGLDEIDGCRCWPDLSALPEPVDLLVVAVAASAVPSLIEEVAAGGKARSVIVIPGGLGERPGTEGHAARVRASIAAARSAADRGPLVVGGNCLGVRSRPGRYDTLFIPERKLHFPAGGPAPLALISQSGAFGVARASHLAAVDPRYLITLGNQIDVTVADCLDALAADPEVEVFACYVEGFRPLDGRRWLDRTRQLTRAGRPVILYHAGRTRAGVGASASHTASVAGDWRVTRELARSAGALVAESLEDFDDLVRLACALRARRVAGLRLGALSNAGFECVAIADAVDRFDLAALGPSTRERLQGILQDQRVETVVDVRNPMDVTPMMGDGAFTQASDALLADPGVDVGVIGCVPLTGALATLPADGVQAENLASEDAVAAGLGALWRRGDKAWVAVVDSGALYDPFARRLEAHGIPTFRSGDRAVRLLETYCSWRLAVEAGRAAGLRPAGDVVPVG